MSKAQPPNIPEPLQAGGQVEVATLQDVPSAKELAIWLSSRGLDTSKWGLGDTKDVTKFWKELKLEEAGLETWRRTDKNLQPVRVVHVLRAKVCSPDSYQRGVFLFNTWQQFGDGRKRTRNGLLSEKLTISEMPLEDNLLPVCERAVTEEEMQRLTEAALRIAPGSPAPTYDPNYKCPLKVLDAHFVDHTVEFEESKSYPGLLTMYHLYTVDILCDGLPAVDFNTLEFEHATKDGKPPKLKYIHAWVWLEWSQIQRYLFEGSTMKERKSKDAFSSAAELRTWLRPFDLDLDVWGTKTYRSVEQLWSELQKEQTQLELWGRQDGASLLMRVVHLLQLQVVSSDARQSRKFLLHMWQQSKEGHTRNINRLMAKKLSAAQLPFNEDKLVGEAWAAIEEQLPRIVDAHFRMGRGDVPTPQSAPPTKVVVRQVDFRDHHYDIEESTTFKGMLTMYHIYTCEVECEGLPLADFTSVDFARSGGPYANGWRWVTWPETVNLLHARASMLEREVEVQQQNVGAVQQQKCAALSASLKKLQAKLGKDNKDGAAACSLMDGIEKDLEALKTAQSSSVEKALPPSMVAKMAEATLISEELLLQSHVLQPLTKGSLKGETSGGDQFDNHYIRTSRKSNSSNKRARNPHWLQCCTPASLEEPECGEQVPGHHDEQSP
mmetsp:Transcript_30048/g.70022  ORF Transcript_30048/g.70022 Transcript_30048/m.70022 type:complete len:664 (-) Transcript_30048:169-2160(-)|eukprot:CAMPEP_0178391556 /NCGR_PEP_ID=MMETSP0689_2-20121128/11226_1 /TAXON_ID=160604 /ORGANISM="Amphidinium massartii, Strain CS-259" /LENGTH=663 /DNA_ID=CAMNT_0020012107 /DNA_START=69 /DNA_END=2060 /DNA_ORIENTATION=+